LRLLKLIFSLFTKSNNVHYNDEYYRYTSIYLLLIFCFIFCIDLANIQLNIRPIFLVKGPRGCGKHNLVRATSKRMGLNFLGVDFVEVQTLTSAQTEAKLRIMLQNAQKCVPCILYLNNIQVRKKVTLY